MKIQMTGPERWPWLQCWLTTRKTYSRLRWKWFNVERTSLEDFIRNKLSNCHALACGITSKWVEPCNEHTARQRPSGWWESKLGPAWVVVHPKPDDLEPEYGRVVQFMEREIK